MDTFFSTAKAKKSTRGNTCCQLFVTDKGFLHCIPMKSKREVILALKMFAKEIGAPDAIVCDALGEQTSKEVKGFLNKIGTSLRLLEQDTPWANKAELYVGIIKEAVRRDMKEANCLIPLWDYCIERRVRISNMTAKNRFNLQGTNAHTQLFSEEGDISNLCNYGWYEWVYYRESTNKFPFHREVLGRTLGPAHGEGNEMCHWILKANGRVVPRRTHRPLRVDEIHNPVEQKRREVFDALIEKRWGTALTVKNSNGGIKSETWEEYSDNFEKPRSIPENEDVVDINGRLLNQQPAHNKLISAEVQMEWGANWQGDSESSGS